MSKKIAVASLTIAIAFWGIAGVTLAAETCPGDTVTKVVTFCFKDENTKDKYFESIKKSPEAPTPKGATSHEEWNPNSCQGGSMIVVDGKGYCNSILQF